ncbi:MAG: hypothetical protein ABIF85_01760 [Nanoarchaeota archaeon]|nr:hypothetical protein [Nanoarchaeota archaeon]MBU4299624.1 hypothetical protein [Nanoarchaeota archaeon]MBU4452614.1 hypothetical protein [Nanoarchaeota archaeon]MCG2723919.1 hypothetical protein [archaeon]
MQELKITSDKRNELFARREIKAIFTKIGATPSIAETIKEIAKAAEAAENKIVVEHIYQKYGTPNSEIIAKIYDKEVPKKKDKKGSATPADAAVPAEKK